MTNEQAHALGANTARSYKVGDLFLGAIPEFEKAGISYEFRDAYIKGYLENLQRPVRTTFDNIITRLGE